MQTIAPAARIRAGADVGGRPRTAPALTLLPAAERVSLDSLAVHWRTALDAAQEALRSCRGSWSTALPAAEVNERTRRLAREREDVAQLLRAIARLEHVKVRAPIARNPSG